MLPPQSLTGSTASLGLPVGMAPQQNGGISTQFPWVKAAARHEAPGQCMTGLAPVISHQPLSSPASSHQLPAFESSMQPFASGGIGHDLGAFGSGVNHAESAVAISPGSHMICPAPSSHNTNPSPSLPAAHNLQEFTFVPPQKRQRLTFPSSETIMVRP